VSEFVKTQQELRANLVSQIRETIDSAEAESRGLAAEELTKIDRIEADIRRADEAIEVANRNEERRSEAEQAARNFQVAETSRDGDAEIFRAMARGEARAHTFNFEKRATLVPSANTVPVDFLSQVYGIARLVGPMLDVSDVITRESGNDLRIPTYTAYSSATAAEAGSAIEESEPTFSSILLQPVKQGFIVKLANELIADAGFDIEGVIAEQAGNAIGFRVNDLATVGSGSGETEGVVTAAASAVEAGTTSFTADDLITLAYSLDGAARRLPGVAFMANTSTMGAIRRLKDDNNQYIYNPQVGGPDTILGYPVLENPAMADIGAGAKSVVFGHMPSYKIATTGLEVATSSDAYFANDVTAYRFTYRFDGKLTHADHVKYLVHAS
jgi:HK97 family phage major capsid protein